MAKFWCWLLGHRVHVESVFGRAYERYLCTRCMRFLHATEARMSLKKVA